MRSAIGVAAVVAGCIAAAVLITVVAYFAFDRPIAILLPGAAIERHLWPQPGPLDLRVARMLTINVVVVAALGVIVAGILSTRHRWR
jgi:hypothetical protein